MKLKTDKTQAKFLLYSTEKIFYKYNQEKTLREKIILKYVHSKLHHCDSYRESLLHLNLYYHNRNLKVMSKIRILCAGELRHCSWLQFLAPKASPTSSLSSSDPVMLQMMGLIEIWRYRRSPEICLFLNQLFKWFQSPLPLMLLSYTLINPKFVFTGSCPRCSLADVFHCKFKSTHLESYGFSYIKLL